MDTIFARVPAKINLALDIVEKRDDGYHELDMLNIRSSLCDTITFKKANLTSLTGGYEDDLILKAQAVLEEASGKALPAKMRLIKNIPDGAGLGGGSADAAQSLLSLNALYNLGFTLNELEELALKVGADVPYGLRRGFCRVGGIGEKIKKLEPLKGLYPLIVQPDFKISTANAFALADERQVFHPDIDKIYGSLKNKDYAALYGLPGNSFRKVLSDPRIDGIVEDLYKRGAFYSELSGSGSCVFGLFDNPVTAARAAADFDRAYLTAAL